MARHSVNGTIPHFKFTTSYTFLVKGRNFMPNISYRVGLTDDTGRASWTTPASAVTWVDAHTLKVTSTASDRGLTGPQGRYFAGAGEGDLTITITDPAAPADPPTVSSQDVYYTP
jgi:hypothetical protein